MKFKQAKNGYDMQEVDAYIKNLRTEYERTTSEQKIRISDLKREVESKTAELISYKSKNSDISNALIVAVQTAKQIEASSKNVYELEIRRIRNLYDKWDKLLKEFTKEYPSLKDKFDSQKLLNKMSKQIDEIIESNSVKPKDDGQPVGIRSLISKMGGITAKQVENPIKPSSETLKSTEEYQTVDFETEQEPRRSPAQLKIKPIGNMSGDDKERFNSMIDKFFNDESEQADNAYAKALIREKKTNGFDLKEALNPKENLAEIMKDFDFFGGNDKNK